MTAARVRRRAGLSEDDDAQSHESAHHPVSEETAGRLLSSLSRFKRWDIRSLVHRSRHPFRAIRERLHALPPNEGIFLIAPFLPAPWIAELRQQGFGARLEASQNGDWFVWLWREVQ